MYRVQGTVTSSALVAMVIVAGAAVGETQTLGPTDPTPVGQSAAINYGHILGVVTDAAGAPLDGALISAAGPSGVQLAVCDAEGRFEFRFLLPGAYLVRAHSPGFLDSQRHLVEVLPGERAHRALTLRRGSRQTPEPRPAFLAAGFGGRREQPEDGVTAESPEEVAPPAPHDHSEKAWRINHARRSVLKDAASHWAEARQNETPFMGQGVSLLNRAVHSSAGLAENLFGGIPLSGQLHLLTRADVNRPTQLWSSDYWPGQIAYLTIGAPTSGAQWSMQGAVTTGDARSWVLAGAYQGNPARQHTIDLGLSYSVQRYDDDDPPPVFAVPKANSRAVGSVRFFDTWSASSRLDLGYGASYSRYDYLTESGLFSPRMSVSVAPLERTRVRIDVARSMIAPGAEEFLPPAATGIWLPPERTFAPLVARERLKVERAHRIDVAVDQRLSTTYVVSGRRFYSDVEDQLATLFNMRQWPSGADHYYLASTGTVDTDGWGVGFKRTAGGRWHGTVAYSINRARWLHQPASVLARYVPSAVRREVERIHDLTTMIETSIPETATHVFAVYRVNSAFARPEPDAAGPGLGARFDLRVKQSLPFSPVEGSNWEVLVMVRSLFRDASDSASPYDELLVVSPPRQFIGGLVVNF